jgi:phage minor structural protein
MLKIYDINHNAIGHINKYTDCKIESDVETGDKTLSFTYLAKYHKLCCEMYVQTENDEYVIKEISQDTNGFPNIVAALNLEELEAKAWKTASFTDVTITEAARTLLAGTGWVVGECDIEKVRNVGMMKVSTLEGLQNLCTAFMCDPVYDTINKTVSFYGQRGEDKGSYFLKGLNLKKLQKKASSYDFYTRIVPIGENDLTIESVNDGKNYLENYQYSDKVRTYIWEDASYTDPTALMEDAQAKLNDLSKPEVAYSAEIRDLAAQNPKYSVLSYGLGDTITLIDESTGTMDKQRIKRMVEYPQDPDKNTCEIANTFLTWEEMQEKIQAAAELASNVISSDGKIYVSSILDWEEGISSSTTVSEITGTVSEVQENVESFGNELTTVKETLGELEVNSITSDEADLKYASIDELDAVSQTVHDIQGDYADFKTVTAEELGAEKGRIDALETDKLSSNDADIKYAKIDFTNIDEATMAYFYAKSGLIKDVVVGDETITGELVGVTIKGNLIEGNTVAADKLVIKGEDGLYYKLNVDALGQTTASSDEKYQSGLDGEVLIKKSITAEKISVEDLVAFGATIGGFHIGDDSIYSGVKDSVVNTTRGIYLDNDGQIAFGDGNNYVMFYKTTDGEYKLRISAEEIVFGTSGQSVSDAFDSVKEDIKNMKDEVATVLQLESSRGTAFKNNAVSTTLSPVIYHGSKRILDIDGLKEVFGESAYLQWSWRRLDEDRYGLISVDDKRLSAGGFLFELSPDDVDTQVTIMCELIVD